jgi:AcrR family transcriptional regulator/DNA-binding MarR family transcriptional regulator
VALVMAAERRARRLGAQSGSVRSRGSSRDRKRQDGSPGSATSGLGQVQVIAMQRSRLLTAAVGVVGEFGWEGASVSRITERAGVSRRTFYELFENRDECLVAVLESAVAKVSTEIAAASLADLPWRARVRGGLWAILCFFDREPALARVCVVESRRGGGLALAYRQRVIDDLVAIVDEGRSETARASDVAALAAHGVVGGMSEVLYSRLLKDRSEPLRDLLGELMSMIVLPYLGAAAANREQRRSRPAIESTPQPEQDGTMLDRNDLLAGLPMRLTYRTARVLQALAEHPGQSNRQVADLVGIADQGQISKLLSRLARLGLLVNDGPVGERNRWALTPVGSRVTRSIQSYALDVQTTAGQTT